MKVTVLQSPPAESIINMQIDRGILETVSADPYAGAVLRWYEWRPPGFSLGYGQKPEDLFAPPLSKRPGWARRPTGGALVFHGGDQSYSLTIPRRLRDFSNDELYTFVTEAWCDGFRRIGIEVNGPEHVDKARDLPADLRRLCLASASPGDLLTGGAKFGGSAQRRLRHVWQQQGFLLLRPLSPPDGCLLDAEAHRLMAANSTDLETAGRPVDPAELRAALTAALVPRLEAI